jgi:hypothetical protein
MSDPHLVTLGAGTRGIRDIGETITLVKSSFCRLKRQHRWKKIFEKGMGVLELAWIPETHRFWIHLHIFVDIAIDGNDFNTLVAGLKREWKQLIKCSNDVDISPVEDSHLARYLGKVFNGRLPWPDEIEPFELAVFLREVKYRRTLINFGTNRRKK